MNSEGSATVRTQGSETSESERQMSKHPSETMLPPSPPWSPLLVASIGLSSDRIVPASIPLPTQLEDDLDTYPRRDEAPSPAKAAHTPSPTVAKSGLPFRKPLGISPIPRRISSTARTGSGRRVSGALQYALQPPVDTTLRKDRSESDIDLGHYQEMKNQILDLDYTPDNLNDGDDGDDGDDNGGYEDNELEAEMQWDGELPGQDGGKTEWDSSLDFGGIMPDTQESLEHEQEEEAWMGYVRQQLNTLFPDFFHPDPLQSSHRHSGLLQGDTPELAVGGEQGEVSISTTEITTSLSTPPYTALARFGSSDRAVSGFDLGPETNMQASSGIGGVPNVRAELGGLREEIERLRGVVLGLAEVMRSQSESESQSQSQSQSHSRHHPQPDAPRQSSTATSSVSGSMASAETVEPKEKVKRGEHSVEDEVIPREEKAEHEADTLLQVSLMSPRVNNRRYYS